MITFAHMEQLLHYCWKHKMWPATGMTTTDGRPVEVLDPGLHNRNAGPDFFNAKVKIGGTLWVGNVEIHDRSSHWYQAPDGACGLLAATRETGNKRQGRIPPAIHPVEFGTDT